MAVDTAASQSIAVDPTIAVETTPKKGSF